MQSGTAAARDEFGANEKVPGGGGVQEELAWILGFPPRFLIYVRL